MQTDIDPRDLIGHRAVDRNGDKIGTVDEVYLDDATGQPEWAAVRTGIFGRDAFVPLTTSEFSGEELKVPYDKSLVKESPDFGVGQHLSPAQELQLYRYYGLDTPVGNDSGSAKADAPEAGASDLDFGTVAPAAAGAAAGTAAGTAAARSTGTEKAEKLEKTGKPDGPAAAASATAAPLGLAKQTPAEPETDVRAAGAAAPAATQPTATQPAAAAAGPAQMTAQPAREQAREQARTDPEKDAATSSPSGPVEITCREERLDITTEWQVTYTARLRKYVTSETVERHVPVVRERVRVERVPVTEGERDALTQEEIAAAVEEVTLREERPVVRKYLVPIERVRLVVERYTDDHVVREELHREHVEIHDDSVPDRSASPGTASPGAAAAPSAAADPAAPAPPSATSASRPEPLRSMG